MDTYFQQDWALSCPSCLISAQMEREYVEMALLHYQSALTASKRASDYLIHERGLSASIISEFNVGFCDRSFGRLLPEGESIEGAMARGALQRQGIIKPNGREALRGCITFPVRGSDGQLIDVYGRKVAKYQRRGSAHRMTLFKERCSFFNAQVLNSETKIVLVSSPLEALSLIQLGVTNTVGLLGLNTLSEMMLTQLAKSMVHQVTVIFAAHAAGQRYSNLVCKQLTGLGIAAQSYFSEANGDINNMLTTSSAIRELVNHAVKAQSV